MRCKGTEVSYRTLPPLERDGEREREIYLETHPDISLLTVIAQALSTLYSRYLTYQSEPLLLTRLPSGDTSLTHLTSGATTPGSLTTRSHFPWLTYQSESLFLTRFSSGATSQGSLTFRSHFSWLTYHPESLLWLTYHSESPTTSLLNSSYQERFKDSSLCLPSEADVELQRCRVWRDLITWLVSLTIFVHPETEGHDRTKKFY